MEGAANESIIMMNIHHQANRKPQPQWKCRCSIFEAAQTRKGKTDEIVAHLDLYERFKHILPEDRYHAAVLNCFDNLPSLQTYDVESTSVLTDKSVVSATSVFGNELTPTNTTPIPSFVCNDG